jgi:hypothetical protein
MTLEQVYKERRLIRHAWASIKDGRELLCLYTALAGDADARPETCPASLAPEWLARLLPWIDDGGTEEHWPEVVERVIRLAPRFAALAPEVDYRVRAAILRTLPESPEGLTVIQLCDRAGSGDMPSPQEWREVAQAAAQAARVAQAAAQAAEAWAARAAAAQAVWAAAQTAQAAGAWAEAAAWAARAAWAAEARAAEARAAEAAQAARAARAAEARAAEARAEEAAQAVWAARAAAQTAQAASEVDTIIDRILDVIEAS